MAEDKRVLYCVECAKETGFMGFAITVYTNVEDIHSDCFKLLVRRHFTEINSMSSKVYYVAKNKLNCVYILM